MRRTLLLVWHSRTGHAEQMAAAIERGAISAAAEMGSELAVVSRRAADASTEDVLSASGYAFCAPENLASTSGAMLEFFHRTYYDAFDDEETSRILGRPVAVAVAAGSDGSNAARQMERICRGWRLTPVADTLISQNDLIQTKANILQPKVLDVSTRDRCHELGGLVAGTILLSDEG